MKEANTLGPDPGGPRDFGQYELYQVTFIGDSDGERREIHIPPGEASSERERDLDVSEYQGAYNSACLPLTGYICNLTHRDVPVSTEIPPVTLVVPGVNFLLTHRDHKL